MLKCTGRGFIRAYWTSAHFHKPPDIVVWLMKGNFNEEIIYIGPLSERYIHKAASYLTQHVTDISYDFPKDYQIDTHQVNMIIHRVLDSRRQFKQIMAATG